MNKRYLFLPLFIHNLFTRYTLLEASDYNILLKRSRIFNKDWNL